MDAFRPQQSHGFLGKGGRYGGHHGNAVIPAAIHRSAPGKLFHAMNDQGVGALFTRAPMTLRARVTEESRSLSFRRSRAAWLRRVVPSPGQPAMAARGGTKSGALRDIQLHISRL